MGHKTVNERLKFLLESLGISARKFSETIGEANSSTGNYLGERQSMPPASYLEKVVTHFEGINTDWLLTGRGEPFLFIPPNMPTSGKQTIKKTKGNVQANSAPTINNISLDSCQTELAAARKDLDNAQNEIRLLREQLAMSASLVASKDETINLLRASYNRPN